MSNSSALFVITMAVAGYVYVSTCYKFRYKVARESGYKLYLTSLTYGFILVGVSWFVSKLLFWLPDAFNFEPLVTTTDTDEAVAICIGAFLLSFLLAKRYNQKNIYIRAVNIYRVWRKNDFDLMCFRAMTDFKPLMVSHESGKVYVGYVIDTLSPDEENAHLTILPIYSGYRAPETHQVILVVKYEGVIRLVNSDSNDEREESELEDYYMAFPRDKINSLHIFNENLHHMANRQYAQSEAALGSAKTQEEADALA
ncbi:hypothetical protein AUP74_00664 [Microbulbifer aggregans]|uniref:Uncharacterized protein n=1 Tax=Microbulbifer aggregans TaxID=1769779 RepID=A0A1C9W4Q9_9GAMM|nr:hypothetical protein [Microbulbifer aggregans]AOS96133.1 hypothetical protein AUP74_00664 [Microbulbifer aggregans]